MLKTEIFFSRSSSKQRTRSIKVPGQTYINSLIVLRGSGSLPGQLLPPALARARIFPNTVKCLIDTCLIQRIEPPWELMSTEEQLYFVMPILLAHQLYASMHLYIREQASLRNSMFCMDFQNCMSHRTSSPGSFIFSFLGTTIRY